MKFFYIPIFLFLSVNLFAQQETEIYVLDFNSTKDSFAVQNVKNISKNVGYDSQPSFTSDNELIYAGTQNKQTEILYYNIDTGAKLRLNIPTLGGEYSPQMFPTKGRIAAVRLDPDGVQQLYSYQSKDASGLESEPLITNVSVAYYAFHDTNNIVASILAGDKLALVKANLITKKIDTITSNAGRSIHKVPGTDNISYTAVNEDGIHEVYIINIMGDNESYYVCDLPIGIQDHAWLTASELALGSGSTLYKYDLFGNTKWEKIADLSKNNISEINRITVNPDKTKIALVGTPLKPLLTPGQIVDAHITPFNNRELLKFSEAFAEDVLVKRFNGDTISLGRKQLYDGYQSFYKKNKNVQVSVKKRIVHNDWVIDKEEVIINGRVKNQITLYKTENGLISEMTFLKSSGKNVSVTAADAQLNGYNARDIDAFVAPYSKDVISLRYPNTPMLTGKEALKKSYAPFFESTPDLHCTITNRLISGNIVVDQEEVLMNSTIIKAVAIYEIEDNEIVKVTFLPQ